MIAETMFLLGRAQRRNGLFAASEKNLEGSVKIYEGLGPEYRLALVAALLECAHLYSGLTQFAAAAELLDRVRAIQTSDLPADHLLVSNTLLRKVEIDFLSGDALSAVKACDEAVAIRKKHASTTPNASGAGSAELAEALEIHACLLKSLGKFDEAEAELKEAVKMAEDILGPDHPAVATYLLSSVETMIEREKYTEVEALLKRVRTICEKRVGEDASLNLFTLNNFAIYNLNQGRADVAVGYLERCVALAERVYGPEHSNLGNLINNLAVVYKLLGRTKEFEAANERAKSLLLMTVAKTDGGSPKALLLLADKLLLTEQFAEAGEVLNRALSLAIEQHGPKSLKVAEVYRAMAMAAVPQDNWSAAEDYCVQEIAIIEGTMGDTVAELVFPLRLMSACRVKQNDGKTAGALMARAEAIEKKHGMQTFGMAAAKVEIATLKTKLGSEHPDVLEKLRIYGLALGREGDHDAGKLLLEEYLQTSAAVAGVDTLTYLKDLINNVMIVLVGQNRREAAAEALAFAWCQVEERKMSRDFASYFFLSEGQLMVHDFEAAMASSRQVAELARIAAQNPKSGEILKITREIMFTNGKKLQAQANTKVYGDELINIAESIQLPS